MRQGKSIAIALARQPGGPPHLCMELWYKEEGGRVLCEEWDPVYL